MLAVKRILLTPLCIVSRISSSQRAGASCLKQTYLFTAVYLCGFQLLAVTKSRTETWGLRLGDVGLGDVGLGDVGLGDVGLGDVGLGDVGLGDVGLGDVINKQHLTFALNL